MQQIQDNVGIHTPSCLHFSIRIKTLASDKIWIALVKQVPRLAVHCQPKQK